MVNSWTKSGEKVKWERGEKVLYFIDLCVRLVTNTLPLTHVELCLPPGLTGNGHVIITPTIQFAIAFGKPRDT